jgi:hypothetical protein
VRVALSIWRRLASSVNTGVLDIYEKSSIDLALKDARVPHHRREP